MAQKFSLSRYVKFRRVLKTRSTAQLKNSKRPWIKRIGKSIKAPSDEQLLRELREYELSEIRTARSGIIAVSCRDGGIGFIHLSMLRVASPKLRSIINNNFGVSPITLDISESVWSQVVEYVYVQSLEFSTEQVVELYAAAKRFEIVGLIDGIENAIDFKFAHAFVDNFDNLGSATTEDFRFVYELFAKVLGTGRLKRKFLKTLRFWNCLSDEGHVSSLLPGHTSISRKTPEINLDLFGAGVAGHALTQTNRRGHLHRLRIAKDGSIFVEKALKICLDCDSLHESNVVLNGDHVAVFDGSFLKFLKWQSGPSEKSPMEVARLHERICGFVCCPGGSIFVWDDHAVWRVHFDAGRVYLEDFYRTPDKIRSVLRIHRRDSASPDLAVVIDRDPRYPMRFMHSKTKRMHRSPTLNGLPVAASDGAIVTLSNGKSFVNTYDRHGNVQTFPLGKTWDCVRFVGEAGIMCVKRRDNNSTRIALYDRRTGDMGAAVGPRLLSKFHLNGIGFDLRVDVVTADWDLV